MNTSDVKVVLAAPLPLTSFDEDVAALGRTLERAAGPIVIVGHAYGGATAPTVVVDIIREAVASPLELKEARP